MAQDLVLSTDVVKTRAGRRAMLELFDAMEKVTTSGGSWVGKKSGGFHCSVCEQDHRQTLDPRLPRCPMTVISNLIVQMVPPHHQRQTWIDAGAGA